MKNLKLSFLFFLFLLCFLNINNGYGQKLSDSLRHYYYLATNPKSNTDLSLAFKFYNTFKEKSLQDNDTINTIKALRFIGSIQKDLGYFYDSELTTTEALKLLDNLDIDEANIEAKLGLYNHLGIISRLSYNYNKAHDFYNKALKIAQKPTDSITIFNNIANVFIDQKQYRLAIKELSKAYSKSLNHTDKIQTALVLDNLGYVQSKLKSPLALQNMLEALQIRKKQKNLKGIYTSYRSLTKYYKENTNTKKSTYYAKMAYDVAKQINSTSYIEDALSNLVNLNPDSTIIEYKKLKDSISKSKELSRNAYSFNKYNYEKKEKELTKIQIIRERDKAIYIVTGFFIVLLSVILYFFISTKHKKDKLKEIYITETRLSQKVHDELANDVYHVINKIQNKPNVDQKDIMHQLENIYERTRDISYETGSVNLDNNYFHLELKEMISSYQNDKTKITTIGLDKIIWDTINNSKKIIVQRVLKELMTNMKKHSKASNVVVTFKKDKRKVKISYVDDGIGINKNKPFKSNGLQNAENRIKNINGSFNFDMDRKKGIAINISLPI